MTCLNMIRVVCARFVEVAFSRCNAGGRRCLFTCTRGAHKPPNLTVDAPSVRAPTTVAATGRHKREDCGHIKLDSAFSKWKILTGPSDWKDYSKGNEGAEKYRIQNLPNCTCPGNYELGVATSFPISEGESCKLDRSSIIPVYLGKTDNVRTRIQKYGRDGAHLESGCPVGPCLFSDIFMRGFSIAYRWAPMKSKKDAQRTEEQLLEMYDYAWNKRGNGDRRPDVICRKLQSYANKSHFSLVQVILLYFGQQ